MKPTFTEKDARKYRKGLETLVKHVAAAVANLDLIGKTTKGDAEGRAIAAICNYLEFQNDCARHFTLGQSLKPKRKH